MYLSTYFTHFTMTTSSPFELTQSFVEEMVISYQKKQKYGGFIIGAANKEMNIQQSSSSSSSSSSSYKKNENLSTKPDIFIPKEKDTLFWCFYVIANGFGKYEIPGTTSFASEKEEKFRLIELLRLKKQALKIKYSKEDVEDELANKPMIGMKTFIALCAAACSSENINVLFIHKRKCFQFLSTTTTTTTTGLSTSTPTSLKYHVIHQYDSPAKYGYELNATAEKCEYYKTQLYPWESIDKPVKAISAYKVSELTELCRQLGYVVVPDESSSSSSSLIKKKDLYEWILMNV